MSAKYKKTGGSLHLINNDTVLYAELQDGDKYVIRGIPYDDVENLAGKTVYLLPPSAFSQEDGVLLDCFKYNSEEGYAEITDTRFTIEQILDSSKTTEPELTETKRLERNAKILQPYAQTNSLFSPENRWRGVTEAARVVAKYNASLAMLNTFIDNKETNPGLRQIAQMVLDAVSVEKSSSMLKAIDCLNINNL